MSNEMKKSSREKRKLKDLKSHPLQARFFEDLSDHDLQALANDITANGLREPIEILPKNRAGLPANTIVSGHQRKRALVLNGETHTVVLVRYDLADADAAVIERHFLDANLNRRQLDPLEIARVALRLYEIELNKKAGELGAWHHSDARDRVGMAVGMSGRNLQRYFRVLLTPVEVQNALRTGKIPLVRAEAVANLKPAEQQTVAARIRNGDDPEVVLDEIIGTADKRHRNVNDALEGFAKSLKRGHEDLSHRIGEVLPRHASRHLSTLRTTRGLIRTLIELGKAADEAEDAPV